jgi:hypothetical protein
MINEESIQTVVDVNFESDTLAPHLRPRVSKSPSPLGTPNFSPIQLITIFEEYVSVKGYRSVTNDKGLVRYKHSPISMSGFIRYLTVKGAIAIGNVHYIENLPSDFNDVRNYIRMVIEDHMAEGMLIGDLNSTASVFYMKNKHDWQDKSTVEQTNLSGDIRKLSNEDLLLLAKRNGDVIDD